MYERFEAEQAAVLEELRAQVDGERKAVLAARLAGLRAAEDGLVFGRIDFAGGKSLHVGRRGLWVDGEPLLIDWRAPAAAPFYAATPARPMGLRRRRHLRLAGREVAGIADEILDGSAPRDDDVVGDGPLAEALAAPRTGRMGDAVTTLQAEQDAIVRSPYRGITVVQGGPGTGKTVVALHRAAYVLFAFPATAERGVLVVGPDSRFLDYISQVLPSLGENDARLATRAGVTQLAATATEPAETARLKGRAVMATRIAATVASRRPTVAPVPLQLGSETFEIGADAVAEALAAAGGMPHNQGRDVFRDYLVAELTRLRAARTAETLERIDAETAALTGVDLDAAVAADLRSLGYDVAGTPTETGWNDETSAGIRIDDTIEELWPRLGPAEVVDAVLEKMPGTPWTPADLALLDEAAALLDGPPAKVYGHVVVDEAQELTEMDWRVVLRRCPSRSMTVVGDFAQAGGGSTVTGWPAAVGERFELHTLTVNYRTTAEILEYSRDLLAEIAPGQPLSRSLRHGERPLLNPAGLTRRPGELVAVIHPGEVDRWRGLEADTVIVVAPDRFSRRDLYVALTRATRRLVVVDDPLIAGKMQELLSR